MSNKEKANGDTCCNHNKDATCGPMFISEFNEKLQKESPEFFKKMHDPNIDRSEFSSEKKFLEELQKKAPKLYDELKNCNFKFKMDEKTQKNYKNIIDQAESIVHKAADLESVCKSNNDKCC